MWFQNHLWTLTNKTLFLTDDSVRSDLKHNVVHANIVLWQSIPGISRAMFTSAVFV